MGFKINKNIKKKAPTSQPQKLDLDFDDLEHQDKPVTEPTSPTFGSKSQSTKQNEPQNQGGLTFEFADPSNLAKEQEENQRVNRKSKFSRPSTTVETNLDIAIEDTNTQGEVYGSDFDANGNIKKRKKKFFSKGRLIAVVSTLGLLSFIGVGALMIMNSKGEQTSNPEDLSHLEPDNIDKGTTKPPKDKVVYEDDVPTDEGVVEEAKVFINGKEVSPLEGYLVYKNLYTNFSLQYPEAWYLDENTQEGFNQIKENTKKDPHFTFSTAVLGSELPLVTLKSAHPENQEEIVIVAQPKTFDITKISAPLTFVETNLTELLVPAQPTINETLNINGKSFYVRYDIFREYDDHTLTIHASTIIGESIVMVYFLAPYHAVGQTVAEEEEITNANTIGKDDAKSNVTPEETKKPLGYLMSLEVIKAEYLKEFMNILSSLNFE